MLDHSLQLASLGSRKSGAEFEDLLRAVSRAPAVQPSDIDLVGRTIGRFAVKKRLGEGGMGVVYEGFDPILGRSVALKVLRASQRDSPATRARLHEEARRVAALHHPNIATVYDVGEHQGIVFLALERVAGTSLRTRLATPPALLFARTLTILRSIASGLACAHAAGIVHRDLKPENVVAGEDGAVKIIDFGIAAASGDSSVFGPDARPAGTKRYMAPEHAAGAPASARADVFAFGILAREILAATTVPTRERQARAALGRLANLCADENAARRPADGNALLLALDRIASAERSFSRTTVVAAFASAAAAAALSIVVARPSTTSRAELESRPISQLAPQDTSDRTVPAHAPGRWDAHEPFASSPTPLDDFRPSRPADSPYERNVGDAPEQPLSSDRFAAVARGRDLTPIPLLDEGPSVPVTAFVDDDGQLVATVRLDGTAGSPVPGAGGSAVRLPRLGPVATVGSQTAEAEVIPDGEGGSVIHLTVRVRPGASGASNPGKKNEIPTSKVPVARRSLPVANGLNKPKGSYAEMPPVGKSIDTPIQPLCADHEMDDVRVFIALNGIIHFTAASEDGPRELVAKISASGKILSVGEGIRACESEESKKADIDG